uniref:codeine O-demethylase-like n=1 Tax=Erigeron canadensis TaxID=72917 RepID=UPI001CB9C862|nr:codeine O-demethylase-like [Erigeron canadensis]
MNNQQVQEIARECNNKIPERYIRKQHEEYGGRHVTNTNASSLPTAEIPVVEFSLLTSSSQVELDKLKSAVTTWGCFQVINHGIDSSFLDKVHEITRLFFKVPAEEKRKCLREENDVEGYGNDTVYFDQQTIDWTDRLYLTVLPHDQRKLEFWPQSPSDFREVLDEYISKIDMMNEIVQKALARSLNLEEDCFLKQYGRGKMEARFSYYPPCPWPAKVLGIKPHADATVITFLLQDKEVEGLEILKDDQWFRVPIVPDALTINFGDEIEIMSNGIFKSPVHRVSVNSEKERMTLALFCMPQTETNIVVPVEELVTDETPRLYKDATYTLDFYFENYQHHRRPIDTYKI